MKEKPKAGLIINWLGRDAAQALKLMIDEEVFRSELNQTLARFKLRNMKQGTTQSCDAYMSQLRLALPECNISMIQMNC